MENDMSWGAVKKSLLSAVSAHIRDKESMLRALEKMSKRPQKISPY